MTAQPHAHVRFRRAIELQLVHLYKRVLERQARELASGVLGLPESSTFERGSPKAEPAARRWLVRYLNEGSPGLRDIANVTASLAEQRESERTEPRTD